MIGLAELRNLMKPIQPENSPTVEDYINIQGEQPVCEILNDEAIIDIVQPLSEGDATDAPLNLNLSQLVFDKPRTL